jgi:hypothetical protein
MEIKLQKDYDLIYSFFKTTTEPFDDLEWDGKILNVWLNEKLIERYNCKDLRELINQI